MKNRKDLAIFDYEDRITKIPKELYLTLKRLINSKAPIIVEGKRDKEAFLKIGVEEDRIFLVSHKTIFEILEILKTAESNEIINLLDGDFNGRKKSSEIYQNSKGIKINRGFKRIIFKHIKSKRMEDLLNYLNKNEIINS